jgi:lactoylglutathione lyase
VRGATQLKVGLPVRDLDASCALYLKLGFKQIPRPDEPLLRYLTFGHAWLILSDRYQHGYHNAERKRRP